MKTFTCHPTHSKNIYETYCQGEYNGYVCFLEQEKVYTNGIIKSVGWLEVAINNRDYFKENE